MHDGSHQEGLLTQASEPKPRLALGLKVQQLYVSQYQIEAADSVCKHTAMIHVYSLAATPSSSTSIRDGGLEWR